MKLTRHCEERKRQRGFTDYALNIILNHGCVDAAPDGALKITLSNREYQALVGGFKKAIQMMDKAKNGNLIIKGEHLITCYKKSNNPKNNRNCKEENCFPHSRQHHFL